MWVIFLIKFIQVKKMHFHSSINSYMSSSLISVRSSPENCQIEKSILNVFNIRVSAFIWTHKNGPTFIFTKNADT